MVTRQHNSVIAQTLESPTIATWFAICARLLSMTVVLPFILWKFDAATAAVWLVFVSIASLRALADFGFTSTFVRLTTYARSGVPLDGLAPGALEAAKKDFENNQEVVAAVNAATGLLYRRLALILAGLLISVGSLAVAKPISFIAATTDAWLAWLCMVIGTSVSLYGCRYQAFLHGMNHVALHRRWEGVIHLSGLIAIIAVIMSGGGLLAIVAVSQMILIIGVFVYSRLCARFDEFDCSSQRARAWSVVRSAWPAVWRSGLGVSASLGTIQVVGLTYAQIAEPAEVAALLLALRLAQVITLLSQPPFYARIPSMARHWALGERTVFLGIARRGMRSALFIVVIGFFLVGNSIPMVLAYMGSDVHFVSREFWLILSLAYFLERYGTMHLQLHSMNNVIIWHWANGISGVIFIILSTALYLNLGMIAIPIALLAANGCFYAWFCAMKSFQLTRAQFIPFESRSSLVPALLMVVSIAISLLVG